MINNGIKLAELNIDKEYTHLKKLDLVISKVEVVKEKMDLNVYLTSNRIVEYLDLELISKMFNEIFKEFNVKIMISYSISGTNKELIDSYKENLYYIIEKEIQSSSSWIKELEWEVAGDSLNIFPPNQIALFSLEKYNIVDEIRNRLFYELGLNVSVNLCDSKYKIDEMDFMEQTLNEEKQISIETLNYVATNDKKSPKSDLQVSNNYIYGKRIVELPMKIKDIDLQTGLTVIVGEVFQLESRPIKGNKKLITFHVSDLTDAMTIKVFLTDKQAEEFETNVVNGAYVKIEGDVVFDNYSKHLVVMLKSLNKLEKEEKIDNAREKRVELHLHTQMSSMDGISTLKKLVERAKKWDHKAIAITDHGIVQSFPEGMELGKKIGDKNHIWSRRLFD